MKKLENSHLKSSWAKVLAGHFGQAISADGRVVTIFPVPAGTKQPTTVMAAMAMMSAPGTLRTTRIGVSSSPSMVSSTGGFLSDPIAM